MKFFDTVDKLRAMSVEIHQDLLTIMLLYSLPPFFENFRCAIETRDSLPHSDTLRIKIIEEYEARKPDADNAGTSGTFKVVGRSKWKKPFVKQQKKAFDKNEKGENTEKFTKYKIKYYRCQKFGHKSSQCRTNLSESQHDGLQIEDKSFLADTMMESAFLTKKILKILKIIQN